MGLLNATPVDPHTLIDKHREALTEGETVFFAYKTIRDYIVFTSWRVLSINVQGLTGSKREYLTVPYRSITAFSVESAGTFDLDAEVTLYLSGHDPIEFKIGRNADVSALQGLLAQKLDR